MRNAKNSGYILLTQEEIAELKKESYDKGYSDAKTKFDKPVPAEVAKPRKSRAKVKTGESAEPLDLRFGIVEESHEAENE